MNVKVAKIEQKQFWQNCQHIFHENHMKEIGYTFYSKGTFS